MLLVCAKYNKLVVRNCLYIYCYRQLLLDLYLFNVFRLIYLFSGFVDTLTLGSGSAQ